MKGIARGFVERALEKLISSLKKMDFKVVLKKPQSFRVMSYQLEYKPIESVEEAIYFLKMRLKEFTRYLPKIIVFPRFTVNLFFGLIPFSRKRLLTSKGLLLVQRYRILFDEAYKRVLKIFGDMTDGVVIGGTLYYGEGETLYIYREGECVEFTVRSPALFEIDGNGAAFVYPELLMDYRTTRKLQEMGIKLIFTSESFGSFDPWKAKLGIWARSQSIGLFGINSVMVGKVLGERHEGIAFVSAPAVLTRNLDGYIVKLTEPNGRGIAIADLDVEALERYLLSLPKTYRKYWSLV